MAHQLGFLDVKKNSHECNSCLRLIKTQKFSSLSSKNKAKPYAPCYPMLLDHPHTCCLLTLNLAIEAAKQQSITDNILNEWLELNSLNYHLSNSKYAFSLWDKRLEAINDEAPTLDAKLYAENIVKDHFWEDHPFLRYYQCPTHSVWHVHFLTRYNYNNVSPTIISVLHRLFPPPSKGDGKKINLPITGLVREMLHKGHIKKVNDVMALFPVGTYETIMVMQLVNVLGVPAYNRVPNLMKTDKACCMDAHQYNVYFKAIGTAIRRCSKWVDGTTLPQEDVCQLSYLEMCLGRIPSTSDWENERKIRCGETAYLKLPHQDLPTTKSTNDDFLVLLRKELYDIFDKMILPKDITMSWPDFVQQRQIWVTSGSAGGKKLYIDKEYRRVDKKVLFEALTTEEILSWLYSIPQVTAVGSEKLEITKPRPIYGADNPSYMILTFLTRLMEFRMNRVEGFQDGLSDIQEVDSILDRIKLISQEGVQATMVDYADFNYQHTLACQSLMFEVITDILKEKGAHPDMIKAGEWATAANLNQKVKFPQHDEYFKVTQGMFSGIRTTNFMNTVLNKAYFNVADKYLRKHLGIDPVDLHTIHKGDDVWITNKSLLYAICIYNVMECCGLVFRPDKQLLGPQAEFLRVRYWLDHAMGYVNRSIGTLIERPIQSQDTSSPAVMLQGLRSQLNVCFRRGLTSEACDLVWTVLRNCWCGFTNPQFKDVVIPRSVLEKDFLLGGLDLGPPMTLPVGGSNSAPIPVEVRDYKHLAKDVTSHMVDDFISYLSGHLKDAFQSDSVKEHIHNMNMAGAASNKDKYISSKAHANQIRIWKANLNEKGHVRRSKQSFLDYINSPVIDHNFKRYLDKLAVKKVREYVPTAESPISDIFRAIHSSPFRDIATAQRALNCNIITGAIFCIVQNTNPDLRAKAYSALESLIRNLPRSIVSRVLQGTRSSCNNYESLIHPIVTSWASVIALEQSLAIGMAKKITTDSQWDVILRQRQKSIICTIIQQGTLLQISKY